MPTDATAGRGDDPPVNAPDDELTFATHDLGRSRAPQPEPVELGFAPARPAEGPAAAPGDDGFVITQPQSVAPAAPVDALVVGPPAPVPGTEPSPPPNPNSFRISSATASAAVTPTPDQLWTTREPVPDAPPMPIPAQASRRGWSTRHSELVDRSANATMLRLREEAVNVSWKAAWIAVTSANPRLLRKRRGNSR